MSGDHAVEWSTAATGAEGDSDDDGDGDTRLSACEQARRAGLGNAKVSAIAAARADKVLNVDPNLLQHGEEEVRPTGEPSKQRFSNLIVRTQSRSRSLKEATFRAMLDSGAEASLMSLVQATKIAPGALCPLEKGDHTVVELADDSTRIRIKNVVHLTLRFGNKLVRHKFYVLDLPIAAILGSDFFGAYHTRFDYDKLQYAPLADNGPTLRMYEATELEVQTKLHSTKTTGVLHADTPGTEPPGRRAVCLVEDVVLEPFSETNVEVALYPQVLGVHPYEAVICAHITLCEQ